MQSRRAGLRVSVLFPIYPTSPTRPIRLRSPDDSGASYGETPP